MDKSDFIQVDPPLGPIIVLSGNYSLIVPAFDSDGILTRLDFVHTQGRDFAYIGEDARKVATILNKQFDLNIKVSSGLEGVQEVRSSLEKE